MESNFFDLETIKKKIEATYAVAELNNDASAMAKALELALGVTIHLD